MSRPPLLRHPGRAVLGTRHVSTFLSSTPNSPGTTPGRNVFEIEIGRAGTCLKDAYGMKLGSDSSSNYQTHHNDGIALFALGTSQVFALLPRPKKDHKYRCDWNVCHYAIGYSIIVPSIVNMFKGLGILNPDGKWKKVYIGILIFLSVNAAILEAFTWYLVLKRRKSEEQQGKGPDDIGYAIGTNHGHERQSGIV